MFIFFRVLFMAVGNYMDFVVSLFVKGEKLFRKLYLKEEIDD